MRSWGHVRLFTPWSMNVSPRMRAALEGAAESGRAAPTSVPRSFTESDECPSGLDVVEGLLEPVARLPGVASRLRLGHRVLEIGREGLLKNDEIGTGRRADRPFRLLVRDPQGEERLEYADAVIDCTGTYDHPNTLGASGIRAPGEAAAESRILRTIPDFTNGPSHAEWEGLRVLLVGAGHSAQTAARDLANLVARAPATAVTWAIRNSAPVFAAQEDDALPSRADLVRQAGTLALGPGSPFDVRLGVTVDAIRASGDGLAVTLGAGQGVAGEVVVDRIVSLTGSVGDARLYRQLQVHECWATSGPMKLAGALLGASSADCLDQVSHGADALKNPEPDFYILGSKSYGRNTTFLLRVGWEQVDDVFSILGNAPAPVAAAHSTT